MDLLKFKDNLELLHQYFEHSRGSGSTTAIFGSTERNRHFLLMGLTYEHAKTIMEKFGISRISEGRSATPVSWQSCDRDISHYMGMRDTPLILDGSVIESMIDSMLTTISTFEETIELQGQVIEKLQKDEKRIPMKITLMNGVVLEGSVEEIGAVVAAIHKGEEFSENGSENYYNSESRGLIPIHTMNAFHTKNAFLKMYREWCENLSDLDRDSLLKALNDGPNDKTFLGLVKHYAEVS